MHGASYSEACCFRQLREDGSTASQITGTRGGKHWDISCPVVSARDSTRSAVRRCFDCQTGESPGPCKIGLLDRFVCLNFSYRQCTDRYERSLCTLRGILKC